MTKRPAIGIYPGISFDSYQTINAINHSSLRAAVFKGAPSRRDALVRSAIHAFALRPDEARAEYRTMNEEVDLRTKEGRAALAEFEAAGVQALKPSEAELVAQIVRNLRANAQFSSVMAKDPETELTVVGELTGWNAPATCKSLVDISLDTAIIDLKTTRCQDGSEFLNSIYRYGYDSQGAFYTDLWHSVTGEWLPFFWVCASMVTGEVWITRMSPEQYASGRRWYETVLALVTKEQAA